MHKWMMAGLMGIAGAFAVFLLMTAMPEKGDGPEEIVFTVPEREVDVAASQLIYQSNCLSCHGTDLQGGVGPALTNVGSVMSKEKMYKLISDGRGIMPGFKDRLSEDELINITTWLSSLQ